MSCSLYDMITKLRKPEKRNPEKLRLYDVSVGNHMGASKFKDQYHACFQKLQKLPKININL